MKAYIVVWPDRSKTLVLANDKEELLMRLDELGDPHEAEVRKVKLSKLRGLMIDVGEDGKADVVSDSIDHLFSNDGDAA